MRRIVHWGACALIIAALYIGIALAQPQEPLFTHLYAIAVPLDATTARLSITNLAFTSQEGNSLVPATQAVHLAYMFSANGTPVVYAGDFTLQAGSTISFELGQFFGALPSGNLLLQSEGPLLGTVNSKALTLAHKEEVTCLAIN